MTGRALPFLTLTLAMLLAAAGCSDPKSEGNDNDSGTHDGGNGDASEDSGDDADTDQDASVEDPAVEPFADTVDTLCDAIANCDLFLWQSRQYFFLRLYADAGSCANLLAEAVPAQEYLDLERLVKDGSVTVDEDAFKACLAAHVSQCIFVPNELPCRDLFEGTVDLGDDCNRSEECAGAAYCETGRLCPGECTALKDPGENCTTSEECDPDGQDRALCLEGTCHTVDYQSGHLQGQDCGLDRGEGEFDLVLQTCAQGYACNGETGACEGFVVDNGRCENTTCAPGSDCILQDNDQYRCEKLILLGEGDDCDGEVQGECDISLGLTCDMESGQCQKSTVHECGVRAEACPTGEYCLEDEGGNTCEPLKDGGELCNDDSECLSASCVYMNDMLKCTDTFCGGTEAVPL